MSKSISQMLSSSSSYLRAKDFPEDAVLQLTCSHIDLEQFRGDAGDEEKPVLYFQGKEKGLTLNRTNLAALASATGDNVDLVPGLEIVLYRTIVDLNGQPVPALRLRLPGQPTSSDDVPF